jgi:hypothetical protein
LITRTPIVIAQDARCCAVTEEGRYCRREPASERTNDALGLPPFVQLCPLHATKAAKFQRYHEDKRETELAVARYQAMVRQAREATVYYVQRSDGLVKIGYTGRLLQYRLSALRREHGPLEVLATHKGGRDAERAQHAHFHHLRVVGEWFRPEPELLAHVQRINSRRVPEVPE